MKATYAPYVAQQQASMRLFQRDESLRLPPDLDYSRISGLSNEERALLQATRPESVGQARRIEGVSACVFSSAFIFISLIEKELMSCRNPDR